MPETSTIFVIAFENRKLLSGEMTFTQRSRRKLMTALGWLVAAVIAASVIPIQVEYHDPQAGDTPFALFIGLIAILFVIYAVRALRSMLLYRRLESGQFIDGTIVHSEAYWHYRRRRGNVFALRVTYTFLSLTGSRIEGTVKADRADLWRQALDLGKLPAGTYRFGNSEQLQELAPLSGTPVKVRYSDDRTYLVM